MAEKLTAMQGDDPYSKAANLMRIAMSSQPRIAAGPEWHPAEQDPLAWWCGVELLMSLYHDGFDAGRASLSNQEE